MPVNGEGGVEHLLNGNAAQRRREAIQDVVNRGVSRPGERCSVAGRVIAIRDMARVTFFDLMDQSGSLQISFLKTTPGAQLGVQLGDIVSVTGTVTKSRTGQLTLEPTEMPSVLSRCHRPLPDRYHGIRDPHKKVRQRALDLMVNDEMRSNLAKRSAVIASLHHRLRANGFIEVDTPILQRLPSSGRAVPFVSRSEYLGRDLYLRGTCEIYLKQLVVAGFERVYEFGKVFRNESPPLIEFVLLELLCAYADYLDMMKLIEDLVKTVCRQLEIGVLQLGEQTVDIDVQWQKIRIADALLDRLGIDVFAMDEAALMEAARERGLTDQGDAGLNRALLAQHLLKQYVIPRLIQPTFLIDYPSAISPLAKELPGNETFAARGYLYIAGQRISEVVSEQNDYARQREKFEEQNRLDYWGTGEHFREDLIDALARGCPPMAGIALNLNRFMSVIVGSRRVNDVVFFPLSTGLLPE